MVRRSFTEFTEKREELTEFMFYGVLSILFFASLFIYLWWKEGWVSIHSLEGGLAALAGFLILVYLRVRNFRREREHMSF